jgi:hypothetical protein
MQFTKCKWFNNHQSACSLMIDDLAPVAVSLDGQLGPHNDWGYMMDGPDSLFSYFKQHLLDEFPGIKGTLFFPLESYKEIPQNRGCSVFKRNIDIPFVEFVKHLEPQFELAFHGVRHTYEENGKRCFEFEKTRREDFARLKNSIAKYADMGIVFSGGKFPGYKFDQTAIEFIRFMNYNWFALRSGMLNRKSAENDLGLIADTSIIDVPTNLSGDIFTNATMKNNWLKKRLKHILDPNAHMRPEKFIEYLYTNGLPITIQEHFQNQGTSGKRQKPNIYDDIHSLKRIYSLLRPWDIWHAECSEIAHYYDSYIHTELVQAKEGEIEIRYKGLWESMFLSFRSLAPAITEIATGRRRLGSLKNGEYIFNSLPQGTFRMD